MGGNFLDMVELLLLTSIVWRHGWNLYLKTRAQTWANW